MGKYQLNRKSRRTIRFNDHEIAVIQTVAGELGVTTSEAIRRLIFWATNSRVLPAVIRSDQALAGMNLESRIEKLSDISVGITVCLTPWLVEHFSWYVTSPK